LWVVERSFPPKRVKAKAPATVRGHYIEVEQQQDAAFGLGALKRRPYKLKMAPGRDAAAFAAAK
jgi:hypothetical protein